MPAVSAPPIGSLRSVPFGLPSPGPGNGHSPPQLFPTPLALEVRAIDWNCRSTKGELNQVLSQVDDLEIINQLDVVALSEARWA